MVKNCIDFARRCQVCQFYGNFIHQPSEPLHPTVASWPFDAWELDIVELLPKSSGGHIFILAATDYFSKWSEVVLLRKIKKDNIPSLRIDIEEGLNEKDNIRLRLEELETLDEKILETQQRIECYQARLSKVFNKYVRPRSFQIGELLLAVQRPIILTHGRQRKFTSKWNGPYVVREVYTNGSYKLVVENGLRIGPINGKYLKRYYA
ncbi:uncharacterized protein [Coffea arabica]|uniref:Integrase catalytic domain-containing protein n=1 Tax=Coffea arabica TaxID=13443 RepID=A0ABM4U5Q6_COFAR